MILIRGGRKSSPEGAEVVGELQSRDGKRSGQRALQGSKPDNVLELTEAGGAKKAAELSWRRCWVMVPSPVKSLVHGLICLFASNKPGRSTYTR